MKISELKAGLRSYPGANIRFLLPTGELVPEHAHVTEVARIEKRFIDCGGTFRVEVQCRLQTWFANDTDHRLTAAKLAKILDLAAPILGPEDLDVDVEHELAFISQFPLQSIDATETELRLKLAVRHTACLAIEKCVPAKKSLSDFASIDLNPLQAGENPSCCGSRQC